jgi:hypothetical protein
LFLVYNKNDGLVVQASETEPVLAPGQDYVFAHDPELNLSNYEAMRVIAKEGCHLELKPTAEWLGRVNGSSNIPLDEKVAKLEKYSLVLMEAVAKLSEAYQEPVFPLPGQTRFPCVERFDHRTARHPDRHRSVA